MQVWTFESAITSVTKLLLLLIICVCIFIPHPSTGYIINDDGQLVPFKIYKKGGSWMCHLHPMNCRGGFHKRHFDESPAAVPENLYNLQDVYKRKYMDAEAETKASKRSSRTGDIFNPNLKRENSLHNFGNIPDIDSREYGDENSLVGNEGNLQSVQAFQNHVKYPFGQFAHVEDFENIPNADLSHVLYGQYVKGTVADPPPLDFPGVKAEVFEYPSYELFSMDNGFDPRKRDFILPPKEFNTYVYRKRRRR